MHNWVMSQYVYLQARHSHHLLDFIPEISVVEPEWHNFCILMRVSKSCARLRKKLAPGPQLIYMGKISRTIAESSPVFASIGIWKHGPRRDRWCHHCKMLVLVSFRWDSWDIWTQSIIGRFIKQLQLSYNPALVTCVPKIVDKWWECHASATCQRFYKRVDLEKASFAWSWTVEWKWQWHARQSI